MPYTNSRKGSEYPYKLSSKRWEDPYKVASLVWRKIEEKRPWIVLPVYWALDFIKAILHPILGTYLGNIIVKVRQPITAFRHKLAAEEYCSEPDEFSLHEMVKEYVFKLDKKNKSDTGLSVIFNKVTTEDGRSTLDTLNVSHEEFFKTPCHERKVTLVLSGNTVRYEHDYALKMMVNEVLGEKNRMAVTFNYPGVGSSKGPLDDIEYLIDAARAQYVRLTSLNIKPENITIRGHSLGGFIAYRLLLEAHANRHFSKALIDRSSPSIASIVEGYVWEHFDRRGFPMIGRFASMLCKPIIHGVLWLGHYENSSKHYLGTIDPRYISYTALRTDRESRDKAGHFVGDDRNIVHEPASFYYQLKNIVRKGRQYTRSQLKGMIDLLKSKLDLSKEEDIELNAKLDKSVSDMRAPKYFSTVKEEKCAHGKPMECLVSRADGVTNMWDMYKKYRDAPIPEVDPIATLEKEVQAELERRTI